MKDLILITTFALWMYTPTRTYAWQLAHLITRFLPHFICLYAKFPFQGVLELQVYPVHGDSPS